MLVAAMRWIMSENLEILDFRPCQSQDQSMSIAKTTASTAIFVVACALGATALAPRTIEPEIIEHRVVSLQQTVTLNDIPGDAKHVRMWVPVPSDSSWQRVLNCEVVSAPGNWKLLQQSEGRGEFVYVDADKPAGQTTMSVAVKCTVRREGVHVPLDSN